MFTAECGVSSPARMCGTRFWNIQELPAALVTTSKTVSAGMPDLMPSATASAATAICTPASSWWTTFMVAPRPGSSPRSQTFTAIASSTGLALAIAPLEPEAMMVSSPLRARAEPPETGAST